MRHQEPVKIQINSLEALERLIGGDPSLEFDIRNNIVQKFAAKHLKAVANSETMKGMEKQIKEMIWTNPGGYGNKLKPEFKKRIESETSNFLDGIVKNKLKKLEQSLYDTMNKELERFTDKIADDIIATITKEKMQDIINKKVDHRLKTIMKMVVEQDDPNQVVNSVDDLK